MSRHTLPLGLALAALAGCSSLSPFDNSPSADFPNVCETQVYADPSVKSLLARSAGSESFARNHAEELHYAKLDAARRCMEQRGMIRTGGVERQRPGT